MPIVSSHDFRVSVILYPEDEFWIAQGIEFDVTARGKSPVEASDRFHDKFAAELIMSLELEDEELLSGVSPAPREFWTMYDTAKVRVSVDDRPVRFAESGSVPNIHSEIKMTDQRRAA
jgi:hypothetical protein